MMHDGAVALPLKGNEFQANHNQAGRDRLNGGLLLYLSKVTNFKQITTRSMIGFVTPVLLLYLSKVTNFKQITTKARWTVRNRALLLYLSKVTNFKQITTFFRHNACDFMLLLYLSKVTNFKQITTPGPPSGRGGCCCFTSQR